MVGAGMAEYEIDGLHLTVPDALLTARLASKLGDGTYEAQEAHASRMRLRAGARVLDLGAGIGYVAAVCARVTGAENVTCVEANPAMLPVIRANLYRNGYGAVTLLHGAVTGRDSPAGPIAFDRGKTFWAGRIADDRRNATRQVDVPTLGLHALLDDVRPHVVVMDIEGAEQYLLDAPWPSHVRSVMMELHPGRYADTVVQRIVDCMSASGLTYDPGPSCGRVLCCRRVRGR